MVHHRQEGCRMLSTTMAFFYIWWPCLPKQNNGASVNPWMDTKPYPWSRRIKSFVFSEGTGTGGKDQIIIPDEQFMGVWDADNVMDVIQLTETQLVVRTRLRAANGVQSSRRMVWTYLCKKMSKHQYLRFALLGLCWLSVCLHSAGKETWKMWNKLIWSDEFDGNGLPDSSKWNYDLGDGCPQNCGWGQQRNFQYYTANDTLNARQKMAYSSSKPGVQENQIGLIPLHVWLAAERQAGRRATSRPGSNLAKGKGVWPAFWMLPEMEIWWMAGKWRNRHPVEFVGYTPDSIYGTLHLPGLQSHQWHAGGQNHVRTQILAMPFRVWHVLG